MYPKLNNVHNCEISPEMTVLEIIHRHRQTETVFKKYDEQAGICICCQALFETLEEMAEKYNLGLKGLLLELKAVVNPSSTGEDEFGS
jgi:hypothetical protein